MILSENMKGGYTEMEKLKKGSHPRPKFCEPQAYPYAIFSILTEKHGICKDL